MNSDKKVLTTLVVAAGGLALWKIFHKSEGTQLTILDHYGMPIARRLTREVIATTEARMQKISAFPLTEGSVHTIIATVANTTKRNNIPAPASFSMTMAVYTPFDGTTGPTLAVIPSTPQPLSFAPEDPSKTVSWQFTPTYLGTATGAQPARATCQARVGSNVIASANMDFVVNLVETEYGATIILTQG